MHSDIFEGNAGSAGDILDELLTGQVFLTFELELPSFYRSPSWHAARSVLDLGTGNGAYLRELARRFPGKAYHGIDKSEVLVAKARALGTQHVSFECHDLFRATGVHDYVILRAVLQHLPSAAGVGELLGSLLAPGGSAHIVDDVADLSLYWPGLPLLSSVMARLASSQGIGGSERTRALREAVEGSPHLAWAADETITVPSTLPGAREVFIRQGWLVIQILKGMLPLGEVTMVEDEYREWLALADTYAQAGIRVVRIDRIP